MGVHWRLSGCNLFLEIVLHLFIIFLPRVTMFHSVNQMSQLPLGELFLVFLIPQVSRVSWVVWWESSFTLLPPIISSSTLIDVSYILPVVTSLLLSTGLLFPWSCCIQVVTMSLSVVLLSKTHNKIYHATIRFSLIFVYYLIFRSIGYQLILKT